MSIQVKYFGKIADITGRNEEVLALLPDTQKLKEQLLLMYPPLKTQSYLVSANKKIVREPVLLKAGDEIALLPPFSGG